MQTSNKWSKLNWILLGLIFLTLLGFGGLWMWMEYNNEDEEVVDAECDEVDRRLDMLNCYVVATWEPEYSEMSLEEKEVMVQGELGDDIYLRRYYELQRDYYNSDADEETFPEDEYEGLMNMTIFRVPAGKELEYSGLLNDLPFIRVATVYGVYTRSEIPHP